MRGPHTRRRDRQLVFIGQLRRGAAVTLDGFVEYLDRHMPQLRASKKTIHRDVIDLRDRMRAPVTYVPAECSYRLEDPSWQFPVDLQEEGLMATLMCMRIASPLPPIPFLGALQEVVQARLAASDPDTIDTGMLDSLVHATTVAPALDPDICATVETAWREQQQCRIRYAAADKKVSERVVEIHGVFLADGAWYTRAWCRDQDAARNSFIIAVFSSIEGQSYKASQPACIVGDPIFVRERVWAIVFGANHGVEAKLLTEVEAVADDPARAEPRAGCPPSDPMNHADGTCLALAKVGAIDRASRFYSGLGDARIQPRHPLHVGIGNCCQSCVAE